MSLQTLRAWDEGKIDLETDWGHSILSGFSVIPLKPLIGVGKDKEPGKEFQGYFRILLGRDGGYCVSVVANERRRCVKEREGKKKICVLWKPDMVAEKVKGVNVTSKVLH